MLEVGGTHVAAGIVEVNPGSPEVRAYVRHPLDAGGPALEVLDSLVAAARSIGPDHDAGWAVAVPGPFDVITGIARYQGDKFRALHGVDLGARLRERLSAGIGDITFVNDADAFALGEYALGAGVGTSRFCCITLGTGVGSGWVQRGRLSDGGILDGELHLLEHEGHRIEERMSRRAIRAEYALRTRAHHVADRLPDVREIADLARAGDPAALDVLHDAFSFLGRALRAPLARFGAEVLGVGGSIANSWDLFLPSFRNALDLDIPIRRAQLGDSAPLIGAAIARSMAQ